MAKLCMLVGTAGVGFAFGWAADALGCEMFGSFLWSGVGSVLGCWLGWKVFHAYFN